MVMIYRLEGQQRRGTPGGPGETPLAINFADHRGFVSMFDGKTLNGWDGASEVWRVDDGAIVGESRPEKPAGTTFLIWRGGEPADFELKLEIKLEGMGNGGIQYRSRNVDPTANFGGAPRGPGGGRGPGAGPYQKWNLQGYQADFDATGNIAPQMFEGGRFLGERGITTRPGQVVLLQTEKPPQLIGNLLSADELRKSFRTNDWNQYHIVVRGNTFIHIVNDQVASVTIDEDATKRAMKGLIGLQVESAGRHNIAQQSVDYHDVDGLQAAHTAQRVEHFLCRR